MSEVSTAGEIAVTTATPQTEAEKQDKSPAAIPVDDSNKKIVIRSPVPSSASAASGTKPAVAIVKLTPPIAQAPSVPLMPPSTECVQRTDGLKMSALLPLQKCYSCRRSAVDAAKLAVVQVKFLRSIEFDLLVLLLFFILLLNIKLWSIDPIKHHTY